MNIQIVLTGYSLAAIAFGLLAALLVTVWRERMRGSMLVVGCIVTMIWGAVLAWESLLSEFQPAHVLVIEMAHDFVWLWFLSSVLGGAVAIQSNWLVRRGGVALGGVLLLGALVFDFGGLDQAFPSVGGSLLVMGSIATSLYVLVGIEQLYRNARPSQQNGLKFLCLGLAAIFAYDIFLYSNAVVEGAIRPGLWAARGFVVALCAPLLGISVHRIAAWRRGLFASRQVIFYTTTLFAAGLYLTLIGLAGYYIKLFGKEWGDVLRLVFFSAAAIAFFALLLSEQLRAHVRVWIVKHFFERKYDYRAEWLRLIRTLTDAEDGLPLKKRAIKALAQIVDSPSGELWLTNRDDGSIELVAGWNRPAADKPLSVDAPLVVFLAATGWIIDIAELATSPSEYEPLKVGDLPRQADNAGFLIPLFDAGELTGFVLLGKPKTPFTLTFEDHDLLKTVGQQIASYLVQEQATERLAESRQFEAFNRFTAFVMHDLKNAIAQQSLIVENAAKHKHNPEFFDDAIATIQGSVERMRRVLGHLRQDAMGQVVETVDLGSAVLQVESHCADREPSPVARVPEESVYVRVNRERLFSAISHAVRNAQDACDDEGKVRIELTVDGDHCQISVEDSGLGMDEAFVRDRLFRPFDSTKGPEGMGIGAYQVRETLRNFGGDVSVTSEPGVGTRIVMSMPTIKREAYNLKPKP